MHLRSNRAYEDTSYGERHSHRSSGDVDVLSTGLV